MKRYNSFKSEKLHALRVYNSISQHMKQGTLVELFIQ